MRARQGGPILAVALCALLVSVPYFLPSYFPVHDTLSVFQFFSHYYSHLYFTGELPRWLPETAYGMPADSYVLFSLGPFQYLAMGAGGLLHVRDALHLFSLSLLGDTLFLAGGAYLFCRQLLRSPWLAAACVVAMLVLVQYDRQVYWNFKVLLPLPACLYLVHRAVEELDAARLLAAAALLLAWTFGSISYVLPVQFYVVAGYASCLAVLRWRSRGFPSLRASLPAARARAAERLRRPPSAILAAGSVLVAGLCAARLAGIREVMGGMAYNAIGRRTDLGVDLGTYLTYGGNTGPEKLAELFNGLPVSHPHDFLAYVGVANLALALIGLAAAPRSDGQLAVAAVAFLLLAFTVTATGVAHAAYFLPGMKMVRHIGYFVTIGKLLLLVLAGFGLRACMRERAKAS